MKLYAYITHGTGDGVEPFVVVRKTLMEIKASAVAAVEPELPGGPCEACGDRAARGEERPDTECECECHEDWSIYEDQQAWLGPSLDAIRAWDGKEELTVDYWDGNAGYLTLTTTQLPED